MTIVVRIASFKRSLLVLAADLLILLGIGGVVVCAWGLLDGVLYQHFQRIEFARLFEDGGEAAGAWKLAPAPPSPLHEKILSLSQASAPRRILPGISNWFKPDPQLIGPLEAPGIGLAVMIREGVDDDTLLKAAGHLPTSALPGEPGNFVVVGHRDTFFRALRAIHRGDELTVRTRSGRFTYVVDSLEVAGPDSIRLDSGPASTATLITCFPFKYIGPAPRRFVVRATLAESNVASR